MEWLALSKVQTHKLWIIQFFVYRALIKSNASHFVRKSTQSDSIFSHVLRWLFLSNMKTAEKFVPLLPVLIVFQKSVLSFTPRKDARFETLPFFWADICQNWRQIGFASMNFAGDRSSISWKPAIRNQDFGKELWVHKNVAWFQMHAPQSVASFKFPGFRRSGFLCPSFSNPLECS